MPYEQGLALWDALIASCAGEAIGVEFGRSVGFVDLGVVGVAAAHASTVAEAFETFAPLRHLVDPGLSLDLESHEGLHTLVYGTLPALAARVHPLESMLASTNVGIGRLTQRQIKPKRVEFAQAPRGPAQVYMDCFGVAPQLSDRYALTYDETVWRMPLAGAHPQVVKYLVEYGMKQPGPPRPPDSFAARVEGWLKAQLEAADSPLMALQLADAARSLKTSRRDLQRRLTKEGTSFSKLQEELAKQRAHELLGANTAVAEVASALGYAEVRSFQRACYRWFAAGPRAMRTARR